MELSEREIAELERRKANLEANPGSGLSWEEVKERIRLPRPIIVPAPPTPEGG